MIIDEDTYLEHWGVKGMRWGVRNKRQDSGSDTEKPTSSQEHDNNLDDEWDDDDLEMFMRRERYKKAAFFVGSIAAGALASVAISKIATKNAATGQAFAAAKSVQTATTPTMNTIKQYAIPNQTTNAPPRFKSRPNPNLSFNGPPPPPRVPGLGYRVPPQYRHYFSSRPTKQTRSKL